MGAIQSSIGLITGVPIQQTVEQLMALSARPRNVLQNRTKALESEQVAIAEMTALLIGIQLAGNRLASPDLFSQAAASSSNAALLSAAVTGNPPLGSFQFTPIRTAQSHQVLSSGVAAADEPLGEGKFVLRSGGHVDRSASLDLLNGGAGIQRGKIRITDRSGASSVIDLRFAQTIDDVLSAINQNDDINVTASVDGDALRLVDNTGLSATNLKVQEVGGGQTASDLGIGGIDVAAADATGQDILRLFANLQTSRLNDGNGVALSAGIADLEIAFRDGSENLLIDLDPEGESPTTLGDIVDILNEADPARLSAQLSADGDRIELTDLTADLANDFSISSFGGGSTAEDLGIAVSTTSATVSSRRLIGGLKSPLLSSLSGGRGFGQLGVINLTDRAGAADSIDLSGAETLQDVVNAINDASVAITARVNDARNGIVLVDTSSGSGNLVVASGDANGAAESLGIAVDDAVSTIDSGSLDLQTYSRQTRLESLNQGQGVALGSFRITDSQGAIGAVNLGVLEAETVGDVIDAINDLGIGVAARINDAGDGLLLYDTAGGGGQITVTDVSSKKAAADLGIAGESVEIDVDGAPTQAIQSSTAVTIDVAADDTLADLVEKINASGAPVVASIFHDGGSALSYRLSITSQTPGAAGELLIDASDLGLKFNDIYAARDALLLVGSPDAPGAGVLASSSNNVFSDVLPGVDLTAGGSSLDPVTVTVSASNKTITANIKAFVDQYNKFRDKLDAATFFNETDSTTGLLFGSTEALRLDTDFSRLITSRFSGIGDVATLAEVGIRLDDQGKLSFDQAKFEQRLAEAPADVEQFFTDEEFGVAAKFNDLVEQLAGVDNSLLISRTTANQRKIDDNRDRIEFMNARLDLEREQLLLQFYNMELAIGKLQSSISAIESIQVVPPLVSVRK